LTKTFEDALEILKKYGRSLPRKVNPYYNAPKRCIDFEK
jgi:glycerate-2-kinase